MNLISLMFFIESLIYFYISDIYINTFFVIDQKITEEVFPYLDSDTLRTLIPLIGERLLFNKNFMAEVKKEVLQIYFLIYKIIFVHANIIKLHVHRKNI